MWTIKQTQQQQNWQTITLTGCSPGSFQCSHRTWDMAWCWPWSMWHFHILHYFLISIVSHQCNSQDDVLPQHKQSKKNVHSCTRHQWHHHPGTPQQFRSRQQGTSGMIGWSPRRNEAWMSKTFRSKLVVRWTSLNFPEVCNYILDLDTGVHCSQHPSGPQTPWSHSYIRNKRNGHMGVSPCRCCPSPRNKYDTACCRQLEDYSPCSRDRVFQVQAHCVTMQQQDQTPQAGDQRYRELCPRPETKCPARDVSPIDSFSIIFEQCRLKHTRLPSNFECTRKSCIKKKEGWWGKQEHQRKRMERWWDASRAGRRNEHATGTTTRTNGRGGWTTNKKKWRRRKKKCHSLRLCVGSNPPCPAKRMAVLCCSEQGYIFWTLHESCYPRPRPRSCTRTRTQNP